jgi:hypothetical protein
MAAFAFIFFFSFKQQNEIVYEIKTKNWTISDINHLKKILPFAL